MWEQRNQQLNKQHQFDEFDLCVVSVVSVVSVVVHNVNCMGHYGTEFKQLIL